MLPVPFAGHPGYDAVFIVTYAAWLVFETVAGSSRKSGDPKRARDRGSYRFLLLMIWAGIALAFGCCFGLQQAAIPWMRTPIFFAGIVLMWLGLAFRYYAMRVLGRYFTFQVDVRAEQTVIEAGPYRYIRHPSYTGALITVLGLGLTLGNWAGILAMLTCIGIGYAYRIHVEEAALLAGLGAPYKEYMGRTQRLVPFVL
ncbi:MAG: isoprenylcysteine carboxylmethyltransferase family protein [Candidatus Acidiferrales bacterium]